LAVVEQLPGDGVGDQPPPGAGLVGGQLPGDGGGDGSVAGQLAGLLIGPEQRRQGDRDLDRGPHALRFRQQRVVQRGHTQVHQRIGAALIRGAGVIS
jgi:hypothetical protein